MTERELAEMLRNNPDLQIHGDYMMPVNRLNGRPYVDASLPKISEHDLQAAVIAECDRRSVLRVEYSLIFAIPNGQYRQGQRMEPGLKKGVLDLFLPVARQGYHGLFIELKCGDNKPSEEQLAWIRNLGAEGYRCEVLWDSVASVMAVIEDYMEGH